MLNYCFGCKCKVWKMFFWMWVNFVKMVNVLVILFIVWRNVFCGKKWWMLFYKNKNDRVKWKIIILSKLEIFSEIFVIFK